MREYKIFKRGEKSMEKKEAISTLIAGGRVAKDLSQRELARRVGISNSSLNDIEKGKVDKSQLVEYDAFYKEQYYKTS